MTALERWIHAKDPLPPLVRTGLAHAQFETIHPFLDGNGRIGRLLIALRESARRDGAWLDLPLPSGEPTPFERQLHEEFEQRYGASPFADPERLLATLFPRRGLIHTVH